MFAAKALVTNTLANAVRTIFHHYVNGQKIVRTAFVRVFVTKALGAVFGFPREACAFVSQVLII